MRQSLRPALVPVLVAVSLVAGIWMGTVATRNGAMKRNMYSGMSDIVSHLADNKLSYTMHLISSMYVDTIEMDTLAELMMPDLMAKLDPHSIYIPQSEMGDMNETLDGEFDGIGVTFNMATDTVVVLSVIPNGPSYKAGIVAGDRIIVIDSDTVAGRSVPQTEVMKKLRGPGGTKVSVGVLRGSETSLIPFEITRGKIPITSIDASFMLTKDVGFIKLSAFSRTSHDELRKAISDLKEQGMDRLIFDLRENSGGFLDQAILIANEFLPKGDMIVYTVDRAGERSEQLSDGKGGNSDLKLVFLIDEYSASSSEILAGAMQDNDRAVIVGRRSFGKGLVQSQIPLPDGSAIRLTVARYYTPSGRSIQKPYSLGDNEYMDDIYNRYMNNEFFSDENIHFEDSLKYTTKSGRTVYGGGGIMPDRFVPLDTTLMNGYYMTVMNRSTLYKFTLDYNDRHRAEVNAISSIEELRAFLDRDSRLVEQLAAYAERQGIKADWPQIEEARELLLAQIRGYIGRNTPLGDSGFYSNMLSVDKEMQAALEEARKL